MSHATSHPTSDRMSCTECLTLVSTADVSELTAETAIVEHCRTCAECANVVDAVAAEAQRLADLLDGTLPGVPAQVIALRAVAGATRGRRRGRQRRLGLIVAAVVAAPLTAIFVLRMAVPTGVQAVRNVELQCLAPDQAATLARPLLPAEVRITARPSLALPVLTLSGTERDVATAARQIAQLDARWGAERSAYCASAPGSVEAPGGAGGGASSVGGASGAGAQGAGASGGGAPSVLPPAPAAAPPR